MKSVDRYLKIADEAIRNKGIAMNNIVPGAYNGAISSFGASIVMSGVVPTIQFYLSDSDNRDSDTRKIIEAIAQIIYNSPDAGAEMLRQDVLHHINDRNERNRLRNNIVDAAIALKIMLRTYSFSKEENDLN